MEFDKIRLETKFISDNNKLQNNKSNLIKIFCVDVVGRKSIGKVELKFYEQQGRNDPVLKMDWTEMDDFKAPIYKYAIVPDAWGTIEYGKIDVRITYSDGNIELRTLNEVFTVED